MSINANSYPSGFNSGYSSKNPDAVVPSEAQGFVGSVTSDNWYYIGENFSNPDFVVGTARGVLKPFTMEFGLLNPQVTQLAYDTAWGAHEGERDLIRRRNLSPILIIEKPDKTGLVFDLRRKGFKVYNIGYRSDQGSKKMELIELPGGKLCLGQLSAEEGDIIKTFWEAPGSARVMYRTLPSGISAGSTKDKTPMGPDGQGSLRADYEEIAHALREDRYKGAKGSLRRVLDVVGAIAAPRPSHYQRQHLV